MPDEQTTDKQKLAEYLLGNEYRRLLRRAIAARLGTTIAHGPEHIRALDLLDAAFPEDALNV